MKCSLEFKLCNVVLRGTVNLLRCFNLSARVSKLIDLPASPLDGKYKNNHVELNIKRALFHFWMLCSLLLQNKRHETRQNWNVSVAKYIRSWKKTKFNSLKEYFRPCRWRQDSPLKCEYHYDTYIRKQIFIVTSGGVSNKTNQLTACTPEMWHKQSKELENCHLVQYNKVAKAAIPFCVLIQVSKTGTLCHPVEIWLT